VTKCRLGHITKQGSTLLRWILGQAAPLAARADADLKRLYFTLLHRRGRPKARVALARNLLVRLYIMLRDEIDYDEFCRRGRACDTGGCPQPGVKHRTHPVPGRARGLRSSAGVLGVIDGLP